MTCGGQPYFPLGATSPSFTLDAGDNWFYSAERFEGCTGGLLSYTIDFGFDGDNFDSFGVGLFGTSDPASHTPGTPALDWQNAGGWNAAWYPHGGTNTYFGPFLSGSLTGQIAWDRATGTITCTINGETQSQVAGQGGLPCRGVRYYAQGGTGSVSVTILEDGCPGETTPGVVRNIHIETCGASPCPPYEVSEQDADLITLATSRGTGWQP